ncbi:MAG: hypothetical protein ACOCZK_00165 [Planctomycetota bacterium]
MPRLPVLTLTLILIACCGCNAPRHEVETLLIGEDGRLLRSTPENYRAETERRLGAQLSQLLGDGWRATVRIHEQPLRDPERPVGERWHWPEATVVIATHGPDGADAPVPDAALSRAARDFLAGEVAAPGGATVRIE